LFNLPQNTFSKEFIPQSAFKAQNLGTHHIKKL